jgi:hypothetical protein
MPTLIEPGAWDGQDDGRHFFDGRRFSAQFASQMLKAKGGTP